METSNHCDFQNFQLRSNIIVSVQYQIDLSHCYAENAICYIDDVITTVKGFQGRSRSIANINKGCVERSSVCKRL